MPVSPQPTPTSPFLLPAALLCCAWILTWLKVSYFLTSSFNPDTITQCTRTTKDGGNHTQMRQHGNGVQRPQPLSLLNRSHETSMGMHLHGNFLNHKILSQAAFSHPLTIPETRNFSRTMRGSDRASHSCGGDTRVYIPDYGHGEYGHLPWTPRGTGPAIVL
eukprot:3940587-Rhodomonas_salina.4